MRKPRARQLPNEKGLRLDDALELMRINGHYLLLMHCNKARTGDPEGMAYYVVPGGYISATSAKKIIERDDVRPYDEGLFPGCTQSWKMGG